MPQIHLYESDKSKKAICGADRPDGKGIKKITFCETCRKINQEQLGKIKK